MTFSKSSEVQLNHSLCDACGQCVEACPTAALQIWGRYYSISEILSILDKYRMIYRKTGGGLSCTGGEPLLQGDFLLQLLGECRHLGIHIALETSGYADESLFTQMLHLVDWLFIDLKHMNPKKHLELTGKDNEIILRNISRASSLLQERRKTLIIRQVVVPSVNDGHNIDDLGAFIAELPFVSGIELLEYHNYGVYKYDLLGHNYHLSGVKSPTAEEMQVYRDTLMAKKLNVIRC